MRTASLSALRGAAIFSMIWMLGLASVFVGCSRTYYRQQADEDVYASVEATLPATYGPRGDFTIDVDPRSRMFDPFDPDFEPMPPDDPRSHQVMECVDCKPGYSCWHANGETDTTESPNWRSYLPLDAEGSLTLDMRAAVATALVNSTDYQEQLEELYLSALDVTFERFRFDVQFFGGTEAQFTSSGPASADGRSSELEVAPFAPANRLRAEKLFATGSEMVVGMANSIV